MRNALEIRFIDGRNHNLDLISEWVKNTREKGKASDECILDLLSDRESLEYILFYYDPGYFNDFNENIGPIS